MTLILITLALALSASAIWAVFRAQAPAAMVLSPIRSVPGGRKPMHPEFRPGAA